MNLIQFTQSSNRSVVDVFVNPEEVAAVGEDIDRIYGDDLTEITLNSGKTVSVRERTQEVVNRLKAASSL